MPKRKPAEVNSTAAKSAGRKTLLEQLRSHIDNVQAYVVSPYAGISSLDSWPKRRELEHLSGAIIRFARAVGTKKTGFGHLAGAMRHIDRRYPKLGLLGFVEDLMRKLESLPVGPVTAINQKIANGVNTSREKHLIAIRNLLTDLQWKTSVKPGTWRELAPELFVLSNGQIQEARRKSKPSTMQDIDFQQADKIFDEAFGLAVFFEVQRQHLVWRLRWENKVIPLATWLYLLQDPVLDERLRRTFHNSNITPAASKSDVKKFQERKKKSAYRVKQAGH